MSRTPKAFRSPSPRCSRGLAESRIEPRRASLLIYGLDLATQLTKKSADFDPSQTVTNVRRDEDGYLMAVDEVTCDSPPACPGSAQQSACPADPRQSKLTSDSNR